MKQGYVTNPNKWKVTYEIEYVDDPKIWDNIVANKYDNDWEHYKKRTFDNASDAMSLYTLWIMQDNIYDCKLFARWETETGDWYEEYIEADSSYRYGMRSRIGNDMRKRLESAEKENIELARQNEKMKEFLKKYGVDPFKVINDKEN